jgi:hypothetical protein
MKRLFCLMLVCLAAACQAFTRPDTPATLRAENAGFIAEATAIAQTAQAESTLVRATASAAETAIARTENIHQQLLAVARAIIPPTPLIAGAGITVPLAPDTIHFADVATASGVRESDGCADTSALQTQFSLDAPDIFVTARALNIRAGTLMGVEWEYQGQVVHKEDFVVPVDDDDYCVWFNISPSLINFSPGGWTVRLYYNETPIEPEVAFTVGQ